MSVQITEKQAKELYDAAFDICACVAADACRVVAEFDGETNLVPYLDHLKVKYMRRLDAVVYAISEGAMESASQEEEQRSKYEAAMAQMRVMI